MSGPHIHPRLALISLLVASALIVAYGSMSSALAAGTLVQQGPKLTGGEESVKGYFGRAVALSSDGGTALVGAPHDGRQAGAAWVLTRSGSTWTRQAKLTDGEEVGEEEVSEGHLGHVLALSADGNTALVGAPTDTHGLGAVWVFTRSGSTWTQQAKLTGAAESGAGHFGAAVALSSDGDTAVVGAPNDADNLGAVWVFARSGSTWTQQGEKLTGGEESGQAQLGRGVALSADGNTVLAGGPCDDGCAGAVWVFTRSGLTWAQQGGKLVGGEGVGEGHFGCGVALSSDGNTALVGGRRDNGTIGAAWAFTRSGSTWTQQGAKLTATSGEIGNGEFGYSVALSADGNSALIGGMRDDDYIGAAWMFTRSGSTWTQRGEKLTGGEERGKGWFGSSVALSADAGTALIGGVADDGRAGAAWVFGVPSLSPEPSPGAGTSPTAGTTTTSTGAGSGAAAGQGVLAFGPTTTTGGVACRVTLLGRRVPVRRGRWAALELRWKGPGRCRGRLKLIAKTHAITTKRRKKRSRTSTIATATFSVPAGKTSIVRLELNAAGRSLLVAHHGRLTVSLSILQSSSVHSQPRTETVRLARQKAHQRH